MTSQQKTAQMRFPVNKPISFQVLLIKINAMISRNNTTSIIFLSLALAFGSCKNGNKLKETKKITFESKATSDDKLSEKDNDKNAVEYAFYEYESTEEALDQDENNYKVYGTDEDGNEVFGSVNIEGKLGIGIIRGIEAKGIEIVAERTGHNLLIATDVKGYEYNLKVDRN